jgi:hypothetical protein
MTRPFPSTMLFGVAALALALTPAMAQTPITRIGGTNRLADLKHFEAQVVAKRAEAVGLVDTEESKKLRLQLLNGPLEQLGIARTYVGDVQGGLDALDERDAMLHALMPAGFESNSEDNTRAAAASAEEAISAIVREARQRRIVIINESHHVPMHRAFTMALARELRKVGYTYFAAETFSNNEIRQGQPGGNLASATLRPVMHKGYVDRATGYYTNEPVFANLLRDATRDGWKFIAYEHFSASPEEEAKLPFAQRQNLREAGQARNVIDQILARDPNAKVLIHAGYEHAAKTDYGKHQMMAWHLKKMSGHDPLTVDQVTMFQRARVAAEHSLYRELAKKTGGKPVVLRAANGQAEIFGKRPGAYDLQVTHPAYPVEPATGRAAWLSQVAGFAPVQVPEKLMPTSGRRLILALRQGAPEDEVPLDVVLLKAGQKAPMMMLPPGPFELKTQD